MDWQELSDKAGKWATSYVSNTIGNVVAMAANIGRDLTLLDSDITRFQFSGILDSKICSFCRWMDGKIMSVDDPDATNATYSVPFHRHCRCLKVYITRYEPGSVPNWKSPTDDEIDALLDNAPYLRWKMGMPKIFSYLTDISLSENDDSISLSITGKITRWIMKRGQRIPIKAKGLIKGVAERLRKPHMRENNLLQTLNYSYKGERLGTSDIDVFLSKNGKQFIIRRHFQHSEKDLITWNFAKELGIEDMFPATIKKGNTIISEWIPNTKNASEYYKTVGQWEDFDDMFNSPAGKKLGIFDYITGQSDRHMGNWLIHNKTKKIYAIDNSDIGEGVQMSPFSRKIIIANEGLDKDSRKLIDNSMSALGRLKKNGKIDDKLYLFMKERIEELQRFKQRIIDDEMLYGLSEDSDSIKFGFTQWITKAGRRIPIRKSVLEPAKIAMLKTERAIVKSIFNKRKLPGNWYIHGRGGQKTLRSDAVIQATKDFDVAHFYAGK